MFYDNLKQVCDEKGVKMTPIVAECGGAKGSISNWKNGALPNSDIVAKLSVRLNVSTDTLIFGKGKEKTLETLENTTEQELLESYRKLSDFEKGEVLGDIKRRAANAEQVKNPNIRRVYQAARTYDHTPIDPYVDADISEPYDAPDSTDEY